MIDKSSDHMASQLPTAGPRPEAAARAQLRLLLASDEAPAAAAVARLQRALQAQGSRGEAGLRVVLSVLGELHAHLDSGSADDAVSGESWLPYVEATGIEALAAIGEHAPSALSKAYEAEQTIGVRDAVCEAAGKVQARHPALYAILTKHLRSNAFVASLSLASYGDKAATGAIAAQLAAELDKFENLNEARTRSLWNAEAMLRVEGMVEALEKLGTEVTEETQARLAVHLGTKRGRMSAVASWLHRRQADGVG